MSRLKVRCRHAYAGGFALDVEFTTEERTTSLFGPSGSGKSSILLAIAGLFRPDAGRIEFDGEVWHDSARDSWVPPDRRRVGMVFQDSLLFPHLTVEENLRYGQRRRRGGAGRIALPKVVEVLELGDLLRRAPRTLSGGERQRVGLGRALLRDPALLLLDEPLVALDEALKQRVLAYLDRVLAEWRIPTVYVSHSQAEVRRLAQWVVAIRHGRTTDSGTPDDVLGRSLMSDPDGLLGPTNLVRVEIAHDGAHDGRLGLLGHQTLRLPEDSDLATGGTCYVQFSPQAVTLGVGPVPESISARNRLAGTIVRLLDVTGRVLVVVDVGQPIWAEVTPEAVAELALRPGVPVTCLIKTSAIQVIP